jgi:predicted amidohydrolase
MRYNIIALLTVTFLLLVHTSSGQNNPGKPDAGKITIASCQFPVSADIPGNAQWILDQMREASKSGAEIIHFPECALSGYPGVDMENMNNFNWEALQMYTDSVLELANHLNVWVLLGSVHWLEEGLKPMNSLYAINPKGEIIERYDKRFCTKGDLEHFSAGEHFSVFEINGVRCGLLICFDVRYPELYREYRKMDVELIFQSFYNARQKPGGIHPKIMPVTAQARAATNHFYMSLTNSSAPNSWPCHFITPDGLIDAKLDPNAPGILISEIDMSEKYYDASRRFRQNALDGDLSSGKAPDHPRYRVRTDR